MKVQELRKLETDQLLQEEERLTSELFNLRFRQATHQLENTAEIREVRRSLARCKTIIRERELQAASEKA